MTVGRANQLTIFHGHLASNPKPVSRLMMACPQASYLWMGARLSAAAAAAGGVHDTGGDGHHRIPHRIIRCRKKRTVEGQKNERTNRDKRRAESEDKLHKESKEEEEE